MIAVLLHKYPVMMEPVVSYVEHRNTQMVTFCVDQIQSRTNFSKNKVIF